MADMFYRNAIDGQDMVLIPAGPAIFGSREGAPHSEYDGKPQFEAELPGFYMGLFCVTNVQYAAFLSAVGPRSGDLKKWIDLEGSCHVVRSGSGYSVDDEEGYGDHPVVQVSWYGAEAYCGWSGLRLPTELEWEKGARGDDGRAYPWGDEWDETKCRHDGNRGSEETCRVWEYPEGCGVWGLYNMSGNVWEWCADWHDADAYQRYSRGDLTAPTSGKYKVLRGGSWDDNGPFLFRCAGRDSLGSPTARNYSMGFRCSRGL